MNTKLSNQGADGVRRVGFYSDGGIAPVSLYIKDGRIHSHQMNCDIVETQGTYRGNCEYVTEFLGRPRTLVNGYFVTPECETKALMAAELIPLLTDSFDFMEPRSAELHARITDLSNDILDWATSQYNPDNSRDIDEIEYILQPFWDAELAVSVEEVPPLYLSDSDYKYIPTAWVIHERDDGYYHIVNCQNPSHFEDYLLPHNTIGDVWLVKYIEVVNGRHIQEFSVTRIKG